MQTTPLHRAELMRKFGGMKQRCFNSKFPGFVHYGGRGITICAEWMEDPSKFVAWANSHGYAPGLTIERNDVNGNYEPSNCSFIPRADQAKNKRDYAHHKITVDGITMNLADWSRRAGITPGGMLKRLKKMPPEIAVNYQWWKQ